MSSDRSTVVKMRQRVATGLRRKVMSPLLDGVSDERIGPHDIRIMARMHHTGVPLVDIAYIFGVTPSFARQCVWHYVWQWFDIKNPPDGDKAKDEDSDVWDGGIPCSLS